MVRSSSSRNRITRAWIMAILADKHLPRNTSFLICGCGGASSGTDWAKRGSENACGFSICWPIPCPRDYQTVDLCSFLKAMLNRVFSPSCLITDIGKSCCCWLLPLKIPLSSATPTTPYLNNKLLLFLCWVIIFITIANQENLFVVISYCSCNHSTTGYMKGEKTMI